MSPFTNSESKEAGVKSMGHSVIISNKWNLMSPKRNTSDI